MKLLSITSCCAVSAAVAIAGCGSTEIDQKKAETLIHDSLTNAGHPGSAKCPSGVNAKKGTTFTCDVTLEDGHPATVTIHITNSSGRIAVGPGDYHLTGQ